LPFFGSILPLRLALHFESSSNQPSRCPHFKLGAQNTA
jgi:hypothetical protein